MTREAKLPPVLVYSPLTHSWYIATRYTQGNKPGDLIATLKYDVTERVRGIMNYAYRKGVRDATAVMVKEEDVLATRKLIRRGFK